MKRICLLLMLSIVLMSMSACALLPEEEQLPVAPMVQTFQRESYELALVERGDMTLSRGVNLTYVPVKTETLRFEVGGEYIDEAFVKMGDVVQAGDLLVQLRLTNISVALGRAEGELAALRLQAAQFDEKRRLALNRQRIAGQLMEEAERAEALEALGKEFDKAWRAIEDGIFIQERRVEELTGERDKRQLRAGIDGTVTHMKRFKSGDMSVAGERFVTLSDSTISAFRAETDLWPYMHEGDEYIITVKKQDYTAVVTSEEALGLSPQPREEGARANVYLMLTQPSLTFEDGDRGTLTVVLDRREDVLMVPTKAVTSANGEKIVYYQDDEGMKNIKKVTTGLIAGGLVEIIEGLEEGENVIVQ